MLFTSYPFIAFIAILLFAYYLVPRRVQAPLLLLASCAFYAFSGWENLFFIAFTVLTVWAGGVLLEKNLIRQKERLAAGELSPEEKKAIREGEKKKRKRLLAAVLLLNLAVLATVKYLGFFLESVNGVFGTAFGTPSDWIVPMGISFYTFQSIGYLVDVYRGTVPAQRNLWKLALFVSFFPQLVQGPISRYGDLSKTLFDPHPFRFGVLRRGLLRVLWGYFKKMVIADRLAVAVIAMTGGKDRGGFALALLFLYTIQLYADFTGGIDITIGLAEALGVTVAENFRRPYCAVSLKDYWRRWHISMCSWFRDYLFYPVSTSRLMRSLTKGAKKAFGDKAGRKVPLYLSSLIVWGTTGLWHGANWNFVMWGLANWAVLMISQECEGLYAAFHKRFPKTEGFGWRVFAVGRTFLLVAAMNLFDCYTTLGGTFGAFFSIFDPAAWAGFEPAGLLSLGLSGADFILTGICVVLMFGISLMGAKGDVRDRLARKPFALRLVLVMLLLFVVLIFGAYGRGYDAGQFIYNRF